MLNRASFIASNSGVFRPHLLSKKLEPALDCRLVGFRLESAGERVTEIDLYKQPLLYDQIVPPGACEAFYRQVATALRGPVLELACETGHLTVPLALDGHEVVALDASGPMLGAAAEKAQVQGADILFTLGDMRSFDFGRHFGLVIVSCNTIAHFTSDEALDQCLETIARHLAPDGVFAFDIVNPDLRELAGPDGAPARNVERHIPGRQVTAYDPIAQIQQLSFRLQGHPVQDYVARMELRTFFPREIEPRLRLAGLRLVACYGDFESGPLTAGSCNQVYLAASSRACAKGTPGGRDLPACREQRPHHSGEPRSRLNDVEDF
jgi:SAM-dependent methyltransferase